MIVTAIEPLNKGRYKVFLNDEFAFVLYKSELRSYEITLGVEFAESAYQKIVNEVLGKRAKQRALHLLEKMDRTEWQLQNKLKENLYPAEVIEQAIIYVKSYGYIDDKKYTQNHINIHKSHKSKRQIEAELQQKGILREVVLAVLEEYEWDERQALEKLLVKKLRNTKQDENKSIEKVKRYLIRKGFPYQDVNNAIIRVIERSN